MTAPAPPELSQIVGLIEDREWRMNNLYSIINEDGQVVPFVMNESQAVVWGGMWWLTVILKDRQRGFSTLIAMFILDSCMFYPNTSAGIIDITLPDAKKKLDKIRFAYNMLPEWLRQANPLVTDAKESLVWSNGSRVDVSTSHRGGTLQILHISEFGKISARNPDAAKEIKTGAFNTVSPGNFIIVESTAEGMEGEFFEICKLAQQALESGGRLTRLDWKFFFFGWWMGTKNELDEGGVVVPKEMDEYLDRIQEEVNVLISPRKRAWYVKKAQQQGDEMHREFPSTPKEAFESSIDGSFYGVQMTRMRNERRICGVPHDAGFPVYTFWDLGLNDAMAIIFAQLIGLERRIINYIEHSNEGFEYYVRRMRELPYLYEAHYLPHDVRVRELGTGVSRKYRLLELGLVNVIDIDRPRDTEAVLSGIELVRAMLSTCYIDEANGAQLIKCLDGYRKEWNEKVGAFRRNPLHNWASNGADAARTMAVSLQQISPQRSKGVDHNAPRDWFY